MNDKTNKRINETNEGTNKTVRCHRLL